MDIDKDLIPKSLKRDSNIIFTFCKNIVDATAPFCVALKPNIAFFEAYGIEGWESLNKLVTYVKKSYPEIFLIADAKRADIGNTSIRYAKAFFEYFNFDAITLSPYMGFDSVEPFLTYKNKYGILLGLTSNAGAKDFQLKSFGEVKVYEHIIKTSLKWKNSKQLMYVVGATKSNYMNKIRKLIPDHFLLIPGIGAQGGSLRNVAKEGMNKKCGILVNSSRSIIYSSKNRDYATKAEQVARKMQFEMNELLIENQVI